tara:strand:+ start:1889 stop:2017 length:129 start_codon:yes stop_codon:yes gene_type:complete
MNIDDEELRKKEKADAELKDKDKTKQLELFGPEVDLGTKPKA